MEVGPTFVYPRALCHVDDWALYLACLAATRHGESYFVILRGGVSHQKAGGSETGAGARQIDFYIVLELFSWRVRLRHPSPIQAPQQDRISHTGF